MKQKLILILVVMAVAVSALAFGPAKHAYAGQDYWSTSPCRSDVWWYNQTGQYGTYYWTSNAGYTFVGGRVMNAYIDNGWQCGWLGAPLNNFDGNLGWQKFENGYIYYDQLSGCYKTTRDWNFAWGCY